MGWSIGYDSKWKRDIGYGVPSICDHPKCNKEIDRGLGYVCGDDVRGGEHGCGLFFCGEHSYLHSFKDGEVASVCKRCDTYRMPYNPKPDTEEWINHKNTHPSWKEWREKNEKNKIT